MLFSIIGNILLFILKIILFLLLFILVIVGLVLLSPIRYNIFVSRNYEEQEGINARAKCLWLLGIIYIRFVYKDDKPDLAVRLFGIDLSKIKGLFLRLKSSKEKKENPKEKSQKGISVRKNKKEDNSAADKHSQEQIKNDEKSVAANDNSSEEGNNKETVIADTADTKTFESDEVIGQNANEGKKVSKRKRKISPVEWFRNLLSTFKEFRQKVKDIFKAIKDGTSKAGNIRKFIFSDITKGVICVVKDNVIKLLKHILPRKIDTELIFGTGDPCLTGEALGAIAVIMAAANKRINITPDFERFVLEGYIRAKGRIRIATVLFIAIKVILSDEWKSFYKEFKRFKEEL